MADKTFSGPKVRAPSAEDLRSITIRMGQGQEDVAHGEAWKVGFQYEVCASDGTTLRNNGGTFDVSDTDLDLSDLIEECVARMKAKREKATSIEEA